MSNAQAERAINQLYESDTLRSELRDEEASLLLSWGESRVDELAERDLPDSQFDELAEKLRLLLAAINVCVGKRKTSPSQHLTMMATISSAAQAAGYSITPEEQTTFLQQQSPLTNQDAISELLGLLKPFQLPPSAARSCRGSSCRVSPCRTGTRCARKRCSATTASA
jgi:hypothetical protein